MLVCIFAVIMHTLPEVLDVIQFAMVNHSIPYEFQSLFSSNSCDSVTQSLAAGIWKALDERSTLKQLNLINKVH